MNNESENQEVVDALKKRMLDGNGHFVIPPPVFLAMKGQFVSYDEGGKSLVAEFPVLPEQLNPMGSMQGGVIATAVDNTVGPLSMLVGPPSVTRRLEMKYSRAITPQDSPVQIEARFVERRKRRLVFEATVTGSNGTEFAKAKAVHWAIEDGVGGPSA